MKLKGNKWIWIIVAVIAIVIILYATGVIKTTPTTVASGKNTGATGAAENLGNEKPLTVVK